MTDNPTIKTHFAAAAVLFLLFFTLPAFAQQPSFSRDALISAAREIMTTTRYCALITTGRNGRAHARTMDAFAPEADMTVWLATNPRSRKVAEIRRNPKVTLYYFDRESAAYVTIYGTARLVTDKGGKGAPLERRLESLLSRSRQELSADQSYAGTTRSCEHQQRSCRHFAHVATAVR